MSISANYAASVRNATAFLSTANPNRDGTGTLIPVVVAKANGSRIDRINMQAMGATTAGMLRFFLTKGRPGTAIASMTASGTTITVTTTAAHGLTSTDKVYMQDAFPNEYNTLGSTVTVVSATIFTFLAAVAPTVPTAVLVGEYLTTVAVPVTALWKEILVQAVPPSATVAAWTAFAATPIDVAYLPLQLAPGWLLQASTEKAEAFAIFAPSGAY